tara:strand:+ start:484 stop:648 length:165 start_codon:yes stop_codon:yes gene_type:complete
VESFNDIEDKTIAIIENKKESTTNTPTINGLSSLVANSSNNSCIAVRNSLILLK